MCGEGFERLAGFVCVVQCEPEAAFESELASLQFELCKRCAVCFQALRTKKRLQRAESCLCFLVLVCCRSQPLFNFVAL